MEWKYRAGDVITISKNYKYVVVGKKEEACFGGLQRFISFYTIMDTSLGVGVGPLCQVPDFVFEEMVKMAMDKQKE